MHGFDELQVSLPRLELGRRNEYTAALTKYLDSSGSQCFGMIDRQCLLVPGEAKTLRRALDREISLADVEISRLNGSGKGKGSSVPKRDHAKEVREEFLASRLSAVAVSDVEGVLLRPGEEALVPAVWDRSIPEEDFICETCWGTEFDTGLDSAP